MARPRNYSFSVREFCFFLTLGLAASCVAALPTGRESARTESTTSDTGSDASSNDPNSLWDVFDGLDIDGDAWLSQSSSPSAVAKNEKRSSSLSFNDDDYDYEDYAENLLEDVDGGTDEDEGNMFLSFPRKAMTFSDKEDDSDSGSEEEGKNVFKHNVVNSLSSYTDDFTDDDDVISKTKSLGPVSVLEDEGSEEDVIFASNDDDEDDDSEATVPLGEKKSVAHHLDDDDDVDSDEQTFGEPEIEGVETIYNDHIFLF